MNELALFAGAGGGILGGKLLGWRTVCAVEWEQYPACVLAARQNDGLLESFPIWDDVQTFDGKPWEGIVDVISGGFPCQDISASGSGDGLDGKRSGMWREMARIIGEVRPKYVFVENSPMLTFRGLGTVLGDLVKLGFDAEWGVLGADDVAAPHVRKRIWIVGRHSEWKLANTNSIGHLHSKSKINSTEKRFNAFSNIASSSSNVANTKKLFCNGSNNNSREFLGKKQVSEFGNCSGSENVSDTNCQRGCLWQTWIKDAENARKSSRGERRFNWWDIEPELGRVAHGVACRVDRLKAIGNGQVPQVAATAWKILNERLANRYKHRGI